VRGKTISVDKVQKNIISISWRKYLGIMGGIQTEGVCKKSAEDNIWTKME
jgi:hypothetical protein